MEIKVLGSGCANCLALEERTTRALGMLGMDAEVAKVTDFAEIAGYGVMSTPALVLNDEVVVMGRVPTVEELQAILGASPA